MLPVVVAAATPLYTATAVQRCLQLSDDAQWWPCLACKQALEGREWQTGDARDKQCKQLGQTQDHLLQQRLHSLRTVQRLILKPHSWGLSGQPHPSMTTQQLSRAVDSRRQQ
jgi:hypothetical protein